MLALPRPGTYPDHDRHRAMHREFAAMQTELRKVLADRGPSLAVMVETNQALQHRIVGHTRSENVKVGRFLREGEFPTG